MNFFEPVEDSFVLLIRNGSYTESKLFLRGKQLFAKQGSGYARLHASGTTSVNKLYWKEIFSNRGRHKTVGCELQWFPHQAASRADKVHPIAAE